MAEDAVERLYSSDDSEVVQALKLLGSLALDDPDSVVAAGGVGSICGLLSRTGDGSGVILQEAAVALYLLLEEQDPGAQAAFASAHGRSRLHALLACPGVPEEALNWALQILDVLPAPTEQEIEAARDRRPQPGREWNKAESARDETEPTAPAPLPEYRVMCRAVTRRDLALDSKRGVTLDVGTVVRPVQRCSDPNGFVTRLQLGELGCLLVCVSVFVCLLDCFAGSCPRLATHGAEHCVLPARGHLDESYQSCWVSEHGLDGTVILEPLGPDGRTPSEVAAAEAALLAQEKLDAQQRAVEEEAARKKVVNLPSLLHNYVDPARLNYLVTICSATLCRAFTTV